MVSSNLFQVSLPVHTKKSEFVRKQVAIFPTRPYFQRPIILRIKTNTKMS